MTGLFGIPVFPETISWLLITAAFTTLATVLELYRCTDHLPGYGYPVLPPMLFEDDLPEDNEERSQ